MINIKLDQKDPNAICIPDGLMEIFVNDMIKEHHQGKEINITIGNDSILTFFGVEVKIGILSHEDIIVTCGDERIIIDSDGNQENVAGQQVAYHSEALLKLF